MDRGFGRNAVAKRVLISAFVGIVVTALFIDPITTAAFQYFVVHNDYWGRRDNLAKNILRIIENGPGTALVGAILTSPLVAISLAVAIMFRRSIERRLVVWCLFAPISIWAFVCCCDALWRNNPYFISHNLLDRLSMTFSSIDNLLFLFSSAVASLAFFLLSHRTTGIEIARTSAPFKTEGF